MNRLRYGAKFIFIALAALIPFGYTAYLLYGQTSYDVEFNTLEHDGVVYLTPAADFAKNLHKARVLHVAALAGVSSASSQLAAVNDEINASAERVDAVDAKLGSELKASEKWKEIRNDLSNLRSKQFASAADADGVYDALLGKVNDLLINIVGDVSKLTLDPDLDSYWLMDAYVFDTPALGLSLSQLATRTILPAADDAGKRLAVSGLYASVTSTADGLVKENMAKAFKNTIARRIEPALKEPAQIARAAMVEASETARREYLNRPADAPAGNAGAVVSGVITAIDKLYDLHGKTGPELDGLIQTRIDANANKRATGLFAAIGASLLLAFLFAGFYLSVRTSVSSLATATKHMIAGTAETFVLDARDEVGEIAREYNQINAALTEARTLRKKVEDDNAELQRDILQLLQVVSQASDGDLTARATIGAGALGNVADAFNELMSSLASLIGDIGNQLDRTNNTVREIRENTQKMASGATNQAKEVQSASTMVEQVSSKIASVSQIADTAADAAQRAKSSAEEGQKTVQNVVSGMQSLRANVQAGAKKMKNLGDRSMEITGIVSTIQRISEQTNMLALNAAIEAARAGEHGRGFTVVADEVRKLAERTASATQEIDKLVKAIHVETNETVQAIERQTHVVEEEAQVVSSAGDSLMRIRDVSSESAGFVANIRNVASAQVEGTRAVVKTMEHISSIAQATQKGAQGTVVSIEQLIAESEKLNQAVRRFRVA